MWTNITLSRLLKPGQLCQFIYFYKIQTGGMKKLLVLLFTTVLIFSCKNGTHRDQANDDKEKNTSVGDTTSNDTIDDQHRRRDDSDRNNATAYHWKEQEQKKFLDDCIKGFEGKADPVKMKDFCSCMLIQAQK